MEKQWNEYQATDSHKDSSKGKQAGNSLKNAAGHSQYNALQSHTQLGAEKEILINIISLLVTTGNLTETEGIKVKQLISNAKGRRL